MGKCLCKSTAHAPPQGFGTLEMAKSSLCTARLRSEPEEGRSFALQNGGAL